MRQSKGWRVRYSRLCLKHNQRVVTQQMTQAVRDDKPVLTAQQVAKVLAVIPPSAFTDGRVVEILEALIADQVTLREGTNVSDGTIRDPRVGSPGPDL